MRLSDDKVLSLVHSAVKAIQNDPEIDIVDRQSARSQIRRAIEAVLETDREVEAAVKAKIQSLSRNVQPGTREYSDLHARYAAEERRRRGI